MPFRHPLNVPSRRMFDDEDPMVLDREFYHRLPFRDKNKRKREKEARGRREREGNERKRKRIR